MMKLKGILRRLVGITYIVAAVVFVASTLVYLFSSDISTQTNAFVAAIASVGVVILISTIGADDSGTGNYPDYSSDDCDD